MSQNRNIFIDQTKGILIILVVIGHFIQCIEYGCDPTSWSDNLMKVIYMFHMPLFIAISGYFTFHSIQKYSTTIFIKNRVKYLLVPMITWSLLFTIIIGFFFITPFNLEEILKVFITSFQYDFWFIWSILFYSILLVILHKLRIDNILTLTIVSMLLMCIDVDYFNFFRLKSCFPFFAIGYVFSNKDVYRCSLFLKKTFIIFIIMSIVCFVLWKPSSYMYITPSSWYHLKVTIFRLLAGIITSITFLILFYYVYQKIPKQGAIFLINAGQYSLGIYLAHSMISNFFYSKYLFIQLSTGYSILYVIPSVILVLLLCFLFNKMKKYKMLSFCFLGTKY